MPDFLRFEKVTGLDFKNKNLLKQAFTHRSYLNENPSLKLEHNERLEFLGDAVLELIVTEYLYEKYPEKSEGEMTALRAALVNANTLSAAAGELGMGEFMLLSKGESKSQGKARQYILANAFEALIGSIHLDQGFKKTFSFLEKFLLPKLSDIIKNKSWVDAKSLFQEKAQETEGVTPSYKVLKETGPDHEKVFTIGVFLGEKTIAEGSGASKQEAEQEAARAALAKRKWLA